MIGDGGRPLLGEQIGQAGRGALPNKTHRQQRQNAAPGAPPRRSNCPEGYLPVHAICTVPCFIYWLATRRNGIRELADQATAARAEERRESLRASQVVARRPQRVLTAEPAANRTTMRTASSASVVQHSHTSAVRRCSAVVNDTPNPPPIARYAAIHMGHFGTSASAMLGSAQAAAPRVRRERRFSFTRPIGAGPAGEAAIRRHGQMDCGPPFSVVVTRAPRRGSRLRPSARRHTDRAVSPSRRSCRPDRAHCVLSVSGPGSD